MATGTTDATGAYSLAKRVGKGSYYAKVGRATTPKKTCRAARSRTVSLR